MRMSAKEEICKTQIKYVVAKRMVAILFHGDRKQMENTINKAYYERGNKFFLNICPVIV
jgi:hypothetical protein